MRRLSQILAFAAAIMPSPAVPETRLLDWSDLHGWQDDDHSEALSVFLGTCGDLEDGDWPALCKFGKKKGGDPRYFFETFFRPVLITDGEEALFTGYYEPELLGSRKPTDRFSYALYRRPHDAPVDTPWFSREEIETNEVLFGQGLEVVWLEDPVERYFLQIQGSGRIRLIEGGSIRVGYGGKNGHPYRSIGMELVRRGVFDSHQVSAQTIRGWVQNNPVIGLKLLRHNPSYVFFREVNDVPPEKGPLGAMNRSVTTGRTVAIDPEYVPLGAPVWLEKDGASPIRRLMVAQDTGSAIKGAQRADIFYGTGTEAGETAGRVRDTGRMIVLLPIEEALALIDGI